jgi:Uma2 family endonuclease
MNTVATYKNLPHYTYNDYVHWEGRWELIDGIPYAMSPMPSLSHQSINFKIVDQLNDLLKKCQKCEAYLPIDWKISDDVILQPDVSVVCGNTKNKKYLDFAPTLIFEILSPSSANKDKTIKFHYYQREKVKYYVLVDPSKKLVEIFELKNNQYKKANVRNSKNFVFDLNHCIINFDFSKIW